MVLDKRLGLYSIKQQQQRLQCIVDGVFTVLSVPYQTMRLQCIPSLSRNANSTNDIDRQSVALRASILLIPMWLITPQQRVPATKFSDKFPKLDAPIFRCKNVRKTFCKIVFLGSCNLHWHSIQDNILIRYQVLNQLVHDLYCRQLVVPSHNGCHNGSFKLREPLNIQFLINSCR